MDREVIEQPDDPHTNARQTPLLPPEERGLNLDSVHWLAACSLCRWSLAKRGAGLTVCPSKCAVIGTTWG